MGNIEAGRFPGVDEYLSLGDRRAVEGWIDEGLVCFIKEHPVFQNVGLVVEGGVGSGETMPHIARLIWPEALYVGTDLARSGPLRHQRRLTGSAPREIVAKIIGQNRNPSIPMRGAKIRANCFDRPLITSILRATGADTPALVTYNALFALTDGNMNPWEKKSESDRCSLDDLVAPEGLYPVQLHMSSNFGSPDLSTHMYSLLERARAQRWTTYVFKFGFLMGRS